MKQAILFVVLALVPRWPARQIYQAESGTLDGTVIRTSTPGYTGTGYVNFDAGNSFSVQANVPDGIYELWVRYNSPYRLPRDTTSKSTT